MKNFNLTNWDMIFIFLLLTFLLTWFVDSLMAIAVSWVFFLFIYLAFWVRLLIFAYKEENWGMLFFMIIIGIIFVPFYYLTHVRKEMLKGKKRFQ